MRRKNGFFPLGALLGVLLLGVTLGAGETRIGVVDMERIFREYYKSRIAEEAIKQQAGVFRDYMRRLNEQLAELTDAARTARGNALNIALSEADRAEAEKAAREAVRRVTEKKAEIELYATERNADMRKLETGKRSEILADIRAQISRSAAAFGYDFVFDSSGKTMNEQPALVVFPAGRDFTSSVIIELNRTRGPAPEQTGAKKP